MEIYELRDLRTKCQIDIDQIDGLTTTDLDLYLYHFPLQKKLAYAYLKEVSTVKLSVLHELFSQFGDIDYFSSAIHTERQIDPAYAKVTKKYVRNPWIWITAMQTVQPYLFDAKYLLVGEFQNVAKKCVDDFYKAQLMHYTVSYNKLKTIDHMEGHNQWFIDRRDIEKSFFNDILKRFHFNQKLRVKWYYKFIEFYDESSTLTLQFEIGRYETKMRIIWPPGNRKQSREDSQFQVMKMLQRYPELFTLYHRIHNNRKDVVQYFNSLVANDNNNYLTYQVLKATMVAFLEDLHSNEPGAYIESEDIIGYFVHHQSVEKIAIRPQGGQLRFYRYCKILNDKYGRSDILSYSSYKLNEKEIGNQATELLRMGMVNIGSTKHAHQLLDYELLATERANEFALQFFKLPSRQAGEFFADYEMLLDLLDGEVRYLAAEGANAEDTRDTEPPVQDWVSTYFEWLAKERDPKVFAEEREMRLNAKRKRIREFTETNKALLQKFTK